MADKQVKYGEVTYDNATSTEDEPEIDVRQLVAQQLKANGYDGLFFDGGECCCSVDKELVGRELMQCDYFEEANGAPCVCHPGVCITCGKTTKYNAIGKPQDEGDKTMEKKKCVDCKKDIKRPIAGHDYCPYCTLLRIEHGENAARLAEVERRNRERHQADTDNGATDPPPSLDELNDNKVPLREEDPEGDPIYYTMNGNNGTLHIIGVDDKDAFDVPPLTSDKVNKDQEEEE